MKVLITGITGFAGSHLADYLVNRGGYEITGTYLADASLINVKGIKGKIATIKIDLNNKDKVYELINSKKPDLVFHLAALASPSDSFKNPIETILNNVAIQVNLLEAIKDANLTESRILIVSSADVYGIVDKKDLPIKENVQFRPSNPYAVSKIAQDYLGLQYFLSYNLKIIRVRPFNHIGPRHSPHFSIPSFAKSIAEIEKGKKEPIIAVGNLDSKRDFTDVRDIVSSYQLIIEKGKPGEVYNVGSGVSYKIADILERLLSMSTKRIEVTTDSSLLRPTDNPDLICDYTKIENITKWKPTIPIDKTLKDTLDYWREIV